MTPMTIPIKLRRKVTVTPCPEARTAVVPLDPETGLPSECWIWTGSSNNAGYGQIKFNGATWNTHRLAYHLRVEKLPKPGKVQKADDETDREILDHLCETRLCCNPNHLEKIDQSTNVKRGARHRRTQPGGLLQPEDLLEELKGPLS